MGGSNQKVSSLEVRQMTLDSKTIHRTKKHESYTRIDNDTLRDSEISFKATGLLAFMLSRPDDWHFFIEELAKAKTDGEFSVRSAMTELVERGYVRREQVREDGKIVAILVHIYERPRSQEVKRKKA